MSEINISALGRPFDPSQISWRLGATNADKTKGIALAYIDARDVMDRLDDVCGPDKWQNIYADAGNGKTCCQIGILIGGHWVWKSNGAGDTDVEADKGAFSDAFKRAAVQWGIGRYLYKLDEGWATFHEGGPYNALVKRDKNDKGTYFKWAPPALPSWALPDGERSAVRGQQSSRGTKDAMDAPPTDLSQLPAALTGSEEALPYEALTREQPCSLATKGLPIARMAKNQLKVFEEWVAAHPAAPRAEEWLALTRKEMAAR